MPTILPQGLPLSIRGAAQSLLVLARKDGWEIRAIHLNMLAATTISFSGRSPSGQRFYCSAEEDSFVERLREAFLD